MVGALVADVAVQAFATGSNWPPSLRFPRLNRLLDPPQTIILEPAQTAVWPDRPEGAAVVVVAVQVFEIGSYWPPSLRRPPNTPVLPPQTIIFEPVQTAVWLSRADGAPAVEVAVHTFVAGSYRPPVFSGEPPSSPPQMIILEPVHTAVCANRNVGAPVVVVEVQEFPTGSNWPPSLLGTLPLNPPQTIIREPVQVAVW
jgi:hypothetical protein